MKTANEILAELDNFTGTEGYHRITLNAVLTDGTYWLAEAANCYWLFQDSAVYIQGHESVDSFAVIKVKVRKDKTFTVKRGDGNGTWVKLFGGTYTDFPLTPEFEFYAVYSEEVNDWVMMLTSEY